MGKKGWFLNYNLFIVKRPFHQRCAGGKVENFLSMIFIHKLAFETVPLTFHIFLVFFSHGMVLH